MQRVLAGLNLENGPDFMSVYLDDHSAVKTVLETPSPNGKHARWWLKIFGSSLNSIKIVYKAGKENGNADALSRWYIVRTRISDSY